MYKLLHLSFCPLQGRESNYTPTQGAVTDELALGYVLTAPLGRTLRIVLFS